MPIKSTNYQQLKKRLDEVLEKLQSENVDVDEATELYEQGIKLAKELEEYLKTAENNIKKIK